MSQYAMEVPIFLSSGSVEKLLTVPVTVKALRQMFSNAPMNGVRQPPRTVMEFGQGVFLVMPCSDGSEVESGNYPFAGAKLTSVNSANVDEALPTIHSLFVLYGSEALRPLALIDGQSLTAIRTASVSAVATSLLARPDSQRMVIFGAGIQAQSHLQFVGSTLGIEEVLVVGGSAERVSAMVALGERMGINISVGTPSSVAQADIICTCTTSESPLFDSDLVRPGTHINAIGSFQPFTRELDSALIASSRVFVEDRDTAMSEAGDLIIPASEGVFSKDRIIGDLFEASRGEVGRKNSAEITVFKSVGMAVEDLALAKLLYQLDGHVLDGSRR